MNRDEYYLSFVILYMPTRTRQTTTTIQNHGSNKISGWRHIAQNVASLPPAEAFAAKHNNKEETKNFLYITLNF